MPFPTSLETQIIKINSHSSSILSNFVLPLVFKPGDLGTRKRSGTSCKIEIHFWFKITQYLINDIRFLSQICPRYSFPCARDRHKVSNSFTKESGCDNILVPRALLTRGATRGSGQIQNRKP
jgi:hypothetical protein